MNPRIKKFPAAKSILIGLSLNLFALALSAQTASFGNVPLYFEADSPARFLARGSDAQFLISPAGAQLFLRKSDSIRAVQMQFVGANPQARVSGDAEFSGKINYLTGNNPAQWRPGIPTFAKVRVDEIYPGVNLVYYGNQRQLEYDFTIAPDASPNAIAIQFAGAEKISINSRGELVLKLGDDEIIQPKPLIYQAVGGARKEISGGYQILDAHTVAFAVGKYDRALPLVIDPILSYSTFFGGTAGETASAVALGTDGSIYITGQTFSKAAYTNGPPFSTSGTFQTNFAGGKLTGDAFVAKFDSLGTNLIYLTYLGGSADDNASSVAVDAAGDAFVAGYTQSTNFPTANALYPQISGPFYKNFNSYAADAFVTELNTNGSALIYSTYLGGEAPDAAYGIALDSSGDAYVTGFTYSTNFPTANAIQNHLACTNSFDVNANAFVTEITNGGGALVFSTYLGGTNFDEGKSIAVDTNGFVYVTGFTSSTNFPTINFISQTFTNLIGTNSYLFNGNLLNSSTNKLNSASDAFVTKLAPGGSFAYSTYLGGTNDDAASSIAVDGSGAAYVTGWTISTNFPNSMTNVISNGLTNNLTGLVTTNAFLTKITNGTGTSAGIAYSVVFGGKRSDVGNGVAVDTAGNAFVIGTTSSTNFPIFNNLGFLRATNSGVSDVFVTAFNTNASALLYSVLLGGRTADFGYGIAVDSSDNACVVGQTTSTNFPATTLSTNFPINPAAQPKRNGTNDTFLAIISPAQFQPSLAIAAVPTNNVLLMWLEPEISTFKLESNTNLLMDEWATVTNVPVISNDWRTVILPSASDGRFFRLHKF